MPKLGIQKTVRIDGEDLPYEGLTEDGKGLVAAGVTYWMFPALRHGGGPLKPLPPVAPTEIRRITTEVPDLTAKHPETVRELFDRRREYHRTTRYKQHLIRYPSDAGITSDEFEEARQTILRQSQEEFAKTSRAREFVWARHGTSVRAREAGLLDDIAKGVLQSQFRAQGMEDRHAWQQVHRLRWLAIYNVPDRTMIYLFGLIPQRTFENARRVLQARQTAEAAAMAAIAKLASAISDGLGALIGPMQEHMRRIEQRSDEAKTLLVDLQAGQAKAQRQACQAAAEDAVAHEATHRKLGVVGAKIVKGQAADAVAHEKTRQEVSDCKSEVAKARAAAEAAGQHKGAPAGGRSGRPKARKAGRRPEYDSAHDRRLLKEWRGARQTNPALPMEEFAREKGMNRQQLEKALQRARARERRLAPPSPS